ncbi:MAG TPA: hypothetical protein PLY83_00585 [Synergistales bacterium]|nr:hypothetical protein [Synergistales bacterium]
MDSFPMRTDRESVGRLLVKVRDTFGDRIEIDILDPRCSFWIFDLVRFRVKSTEPVWILDGKLLFRGIPGWTELEGVLAERLGME